MKDVFGYELKVGDTLTYAQHEWSAIVVSHWRIDEITPAGFAKATVVDQGSASYYTARAGTQALLKAVGLRGVRTGPQMET